MTNLAQKIQDLTVESFNAQDFKGLAQVITVTPVKSNKKSRVTGNATPSIVAKAKTYAYETVSLGNDYESVVNRRRGQEEKEKNFESQGTYCHPISENKMLWQHNKSEQLYVRMYSNLGGNFHGKKMIVSEDENGNTVRMDVKEFYETYAEYLPPKSKNKSQGLSEAKEVRVKNVKLENVQYLKRGDFTYNTLTVETIQELSA